MQSQSIKNNTSNQPINSHLVLKQIQGMAINGCEIENHTQRTYHYEIFYLTSGIGKISVNLQHHELNPQHVHFLSPGQLRQVELDENCQGYYLSVSEDFLNVSDNQFVLTFLLRHCRGLGNALIMELDKSDQYETMETLRKMAKEINKEHALQIELLQALFKTFLLYISKNNSIGDKTNPHSNDIRIVKHFLQSVNKQFIKKKMVADYADELCVTRNYLNKVVKKVSGFTASQIIQQCIIQEAKKQVIRSGSSMKQIAYNLGFEDCAHFSKFFKTNSGVNFTNFRKEIINISWHFII